MKRTSLSILASLCLSILYAQADRHLTITEHGSKKLLPYATVQVVNKNTGHYADENGKIRLAIGQEDTLLVSYVGYISRYVVVASLISDTISIALDSLKLNEIVIKPYVNDGQTVQIGSVKSKKSVGLSGKMAFELAVKLDLPVDHSEFQLSAISLPITKINRNNPVRLHIYEVDKEGKPGNELLKHDLLITEHPENRIYTIDVSTQRIIVSDKSIFVSIEWLGSPHIENADSGPKIRLGLSDPVLRTFTRTSTKPWYGWVVFNPKTDNHNPMNLLASISLQPIKRK